MARKGALARAGGLAVVALLAVSGCAPEADSEAGAGLLLPTLGARLQQIDRLQLRGAGDHVLVTLVRNDGEWRVAERAGWRADGARVDRYLALLAQARLVEAKSPNPAMYPRMGLEDIAGADATGTELSLSGAGASQRLLIGKLHKISGGRYVRVDGGARSWLTDSDVGFDPEPVSWLDRRLTDVPLARVEKVRIRPRGGKAFALVSRDDRFRPDDAPAGAMHDSHAGDAIASVLQDFEVEDVGEDSAGGRVSQELDFELVDGAVLTVAIWREGQRDWARLSASYDEARGAGWQRLSGRADLTARAREAVADWNRRFRGRRFLLPTALASTLMQDYFQILDGPPEPLP